MEIKEIFASEYDYKIINIAKFKKRNFYAKFPLNFSISCNVLFGAGQTFAVFVVFHRSAKVFPMNPLH